MMAAAAGVAAYGVVSPRSQLFGPQLWRLEGRGKAVALTFDDGPQEPDTPRLLDLLAGENVAATFFVLGRQAERHPGLVRRIRAEGHELGVHGFSHRSMLWLSSREMGAEIDQTLALLGRGVRLLRPPYGFKDPRLFRVAGERGLEVAGWTVHGADWRKASPEKIASRILGRIEPGAIVLLHDGCGEEPGRSRAATLKAVGLLITELKARGFMFDTVSRGA
jgi:peptidoglycan/xylan/chitin deacetylase (PgdA/CDA1 family)